MTKSNKNRFMGPPSPTASVEDWLQWRKFLEGLGRQRPLIRQAIHEAEDMIVRLKCPGESRPKSRNLSAR